MANRNFNNRMYSFEVNPTLVNAEFTIGNAGAVGTVIGNGITSLTRTAAGKYALTLADKYNRVISAYANVVAETITAAVTCLTGKSEVQTVTFAAKASCTAGDFCVLTDSAGLKWAFSIDKAGTDPEPTSALWTAIPTARKAHVNISAASSASDVEDAIELAFDALVSNPFTTSKSTADMVTTCTLRANITNGAVYKLDGTASPTSFTIANTTAGVNTAVNVTANTFTITNHGLIKGRKVQLSISGGGTLPTGVTTTTDYYIIYVDANTIKFASSLANAEAGTAIDITDYGTADKTITVTPFNPFGSNVARIEFSNANIHTDIAAGNAITFTCFDYAGAVTDPLPNGLMQVALWVRNSGIKAKGE